MKKFAWVVSLCGVALFNVNAAQAQLGACCQQAGCFNNFGPQDCAKFKGFWLGEGSTCATDTCPDCDCDGVSNVTEIEDCVDALCAAIAGSCPANHVTYRDICAGKLNCNADLTPGTCCNPTTGVETTLCDIFQGGPTDNCTNDSCATDTFGDDAKGDPTKDCLVDRGHGAPVHTPVDGFCDENKDGWTCSTTPTGQAAIPCGDKDSTSTCPSTCSLSGVKCSPANPCDGVCKADPTVFCKDDSDCVAFSPDNNCAPQTCDANTCQDNDECDYYICQPSAFANNLGCDEKFTVAGTLCPKGGPAEKTDKSDVPCDSPNTCDGKGVCQGNFAPTGTPCTADQECQQNEANCSNPKTCTNKVCSNDVYANCTTAAADCGRCAHGGEQCTALTVVAACGKVCSNCTNKACTDDDDCGPGASECGGPYKGRCVADTCTVGTCGADTCSASTCTTDTCLAGQCLHTAVADGTACASDGNQCTSNTCLAGKCTETPTYGAACDDDDVCTNGETCQFNAAYPPKYDINCQGGTTKGCSDTNDCTTDFCNACDSRADPETGCVNTYAGAENLSSFPECSQIMCRMHLSKDGSGPNTYPANQFPESDDKRNNKCDDDNFGSVLLNSCYNLEVWCIDGSKQQSGLACIFNTVFQNTDTGCPNSIEDNDGDGDLGITISKHFPHFQNGLVFDKDQFVLDLGGCANEACIGVEEWAKVATIEMAASQKECKFSNGFPAFVELQAASESKGSSLWGKQDKKTPTYPKKDPFFYDVICWGNIYEHDGNCQDQINAGDWSMFAPCWLDKTDGNEPESKLCAEFDYDRNGLVDPGDFSVFATAWQKDVCAGGIVVPCEQLKGCSCQLPSNGISSDGNGNMTEVEIPWASVEVVQDAGLVYPPRDWEGWQVAPVGEFEKAYPSRTPARLNRGVKSIR